MTKETSFQGWDVLIVDDSLPSLDIVQVILNRHGAVVHRATNGLDALKMVEQQQPRLIITDLAMPVMDGWELIARLKGSPDTAHIPVIALTAHAMLDDRQRAIAAGCNHFLVKPITPTTFINDLLSVIADIPQLK